MSPRLSVVVPFHGVEDYIGDSLESLRRQTMTDLEVILVDDGSTDGSGRIAQSYVDKDDRFSVVVQESQGPGPARNTGIRHASGEFLAFVDSDDLVPWQAFEHMVHVLEQTGSSLVAGNARRFNRSGGVRPSWTHRIAFARTEMATHVLDRPELIADRMVWNKVYRRDFWDASGLEFPAIRYEDYPVALKAHLDALTVDILAAPVYYWRERESGDSITQQVFRYDNLVDRVVSAEMVLAITDRATMAVRDKTEEHLAEIDLVALAQAFEVIPDSEVDSLVALGRRFTDLIRPRALSRRPRLDRIQYTALKAGDVELLRELAAFRSAGRLDAKNVRRRRDRPWILEERIPGRGGKTAPRDLYRVPRSSLNLVTTVEDVRWNEESLTVRGTARIQHVPVSDKSTLHLALVCGKNRVDVPVTSSSIVEADDGTSRIEFAALLDLAVLESAPWAAWPLRFEVTLGHGVLRRRLPLRGLQDGSPRWPGGAWIGHDIWVQTATARDGALQVVRTTRPIVVEEVSVSESAFLIRGCAPGNVQGVQLKINRPAPREATLVPVQTTPQGAKTIFHARLDLEDLLSNETPEDPYTLRTAWPVWLATDEGDQRIAWSEGYQGVTIPYGDEIVSLTATSGKSLIAVREPAQPKVDSVEFSADGHLTVGGAWWPMATPKEFSWRRFLPNSDDHVDVVCDLALEDGRWTARAPLADLAALEAESVSPAGPRANWSLFVSANDTDLAVKCTPLIGSRLPVIHSRSQAAMRATMVRDTLHVEVR